jgi:hypothetical protein
MSEGRGPGEGNNPVEQTGYDPANYKSPAAQREIAQKEQGNPAEKQKEQERINREAPGSYQSPVAGHDWEQENDPGRERSR